MPTPKPQRRAHANAQAWQTAWGPRRRRSSTSGIALLGVMIGGMLGALITDPTAWRDLKRVVGAPVEPFPELRGRPTRVVDGDTFRFGKTRIRLLGVDAPEMSAPQGPGAKDQLARLIADSPAGLRCEDTGERTYERVVARCYAADGGDLSAAMAEAGWATVMLRFSGAAYLPAQMRAMWKRRGMWSEI